jgi:hypothetical protein
MRAVREQRFEPGPQADDSLIEVPDSLACGSASGMTGEPYSQPLRLK